MSDPYQEYTKALARYAVALARLKEAKRALTKAKAKPQPRTYTLAEIDSFFPPSPALETTVDPKIGSTFRIINIPENDDE